MAVTHCELHSLISRTHHQVRETNDDPGKGAAVDHDPVGRDNLLVEGDAEGLAGQLLRRQRLGCESAACWERRRQQLLSG